jgi:hypothetical protein
MKAGKRPGVVRADELYTLDELKRRLGVEVYALRQMKRAGLRVVQFGRRSYVLGRSVLEFFEGVESNGSAGQGRAAESATPGSTLG